MKPIALAVIAAALLSACASTDLEKHAAAERQAHDQAMAARSASTTPAMSTLEPAATKSTGVTTTMVVSDAGGSSATLELADRAAATEQHAWLRQLAGEWTFSCKATMAEGAPPFEMSGTESVRTIGDLWVVAEGHAETGGEQLHSVMSLGYDPKTQAFIGTWFDSSQTHLWSYKGALDAGKTKLTLDTEGPSFDDPSKMSRYRDAIELKDKDHKVLTSSVQNADGSWMTFMRMEFVRAK